MDSRGIKRYWRTHGSASAVALIAAAVMVAVVWGVLLAVSPEPVEPINSTRSAQPANLDTDDETIALTIGDSYTGGSDMNSGPTWEERLAVQRGWVPVEDAVGGTGYIARSELGPSLQKRVGRTVAEFDPDVVLVAMGLNDSQHPNDAVIAGARSVLQRIDQGFPKADVVVLSPFSPRPIPEVEQLEAELRKVAADLGLPYVDVTAAFYDHPDLIGSDGTHPTDAGHRYLARYVGQRLPG